MKKKTSKLNVERETLRRLANVELARAGGGIDTGAANCVVARGPAATVGCQTA